MQGAAHAIGELYCIGINLRGCGVGEDYRALARERGGRVLTDEPAVNYQAMARFFFGSSLLTDREAAHRRVVDKAKQHQWYLTAYAAHRDHILARKRERYRLQREALGLVVKART